MQQRFASTIGAFFLVVATVGPGAAQEATEDQEAARTHFGNGVTWYREGRTAAACRAFEQAYQALPHYAVLYNLGQCLAQLGQPVQALQTFQRYLQQGGEQLPDERRREVEGEIRSLHGQVGRIRLVVEPAAEATLHLNGQLLEGPRDRELLLEPGTHRIEVEAPGYQTQRETLTVVAGQRRQVQLRLPRIPPPTGTLVVEANLSAFVVTVNGEARGPLAPGQGLPLPAGIHQVEVSRPGYVPVRRTVTLEAHQTSSLEVSLEPQEPLPSELAGVLEVHISAEGSLITVDGRPLPDGPLPVGPHRLTVRHGNFLPWSREVQVVAGSTVVQRVHLEPTPGYRALLARQARSWRIGLTTTLTLAVATLGATFCLFVWNSIRDQEWANEGRVLGEEFALRVNGGQNTELLQDDLESNAALGQELQTWSRAEWGLMAVGLTTAVASAVLLLLRRGPRGPGLRWRPAAGGLAWAWGGPDQGQGGR